MPGSGAGRGCRYAAHAGETKFDLPKEPLLFTKTTNCLSGPDDPVLRFQLREGFQYCGVIHGYLPSDEESRGNATIIVWVNDRFKPDQPTKIPEGPIL